MKSNWIIGRTPRGASRTPEWMCWSAMLRRCNQPKDKKYKHYGARGITTCREWHCFSNFLRDMGPKPSPALSIERIDNNGNYEPANCRWATMKEQSNNRRSSRLIKHNGRTLTLTQWAEEIGVMPGTIKDRLIDGWPVWRALSKARPRQCLKFNGEALTLTQSARAFGLLLGTLRNRIASGWSIERALTTPSRTAKRKERTQETV